ncbi:hypothetical protein D3C71_1614150 [compost metagenome]
MVPVIAVGQSTDPVNHLKAHWCGADIPRPAIVFPSHGHAGAGGFLTLIAAAPLSIAGTEGFVIFAAAVGGEAAGIQLYGIGTEKRPPVIPRHIDL